MNNTGSGYVANIRGIKNVNELGIAEKFVRIETVEHMHVHFDAKPDQLVEEKAPEVQCAPSAPTEKIEVLKSITKEESLITTPTNSPQMLAKDFYGEEDEAENSEEIDFSDLILLGVGVAIKSIAPKTAHAAHGAAIRAYKTYTFMKSLLA